MSLKRTVFRGVGWQVGSDLFQKTLTVAATILLARLVGPRAFGVFALAMVLVNALGILKSLGMDDALIRMADHRPRAVSTAFSATLAAGIVLYAALWLAAPAAAAFFADPAFVPVLRVLGIAILIQSVSRIPMAVLERQMRFKETAIAETMGALAYSAVAIILALDGRGIWAIVYGYLSRVGIAAVVTWIFMGGKIRIAYHHDQAREMFGFGKFMLGASALSFAKQNLDNLLVGRLLGMTQLGYYSVAFTLAHLSAEYLGVRVQRVIYPAYARIQADAERLKPAVLKTFRYLCLIAWPFGAAVVLFGGDFLKLAYGPLWTEAAPILRILAFAGVLNTIHVSWSGLFGATGKPRYSFFAMSAQVSVFLVLIVPAARRYGLLGVGASVCAAAAAAFLLELGFASRILGLPKRALASGMSIPLLASLVMGGGTVLIRRLIARPAPAASLSIPGFVALAAAALAIYAAAAFLLDPGLGKRIRRDLSSAGPQ